MSTLTLDFLQEYREALMAEPTEDVVVEIIPRMPRSKKKRIRNKWRKDPRHWVFVDGPKIKF